jgi:hypothetical protein
MLNCAFREIGVGYTYLANDTGDTNYHHYWVQDLGEPRGEVSNTATPTRTRTLTRTPTITPIPTATPLVCNARPAPPELIAPGADAQVNAASVPLDWNDNACVKKYRVVVKREAPDGDAAYKKGGLKVSADVTEMLTPGTYSWRVRACNAKGCTPSTWRMFGIVIY